MGSHEAGSYLHHLQRRFLSPYHRQFTTTQVISKFVKLCRKQDNTRGNNEELEQRSLICL
jgi:hypothetical protein